MRANAAQKATTHGEKTKVGAAPEVAAAAAGQVEGEEDVKILGRMGKASRRINRIGWCRIVWRKQTGEVQKKSQPAWVV